MEGKYGCGICSAWFSSNQSLKNHQATVHDLMIMKLHECVFCKKGFAHKGALTRHVSAHTKERPYFCKLCPGECADKACLRKHLETRHNPVRSKDNKCDFCSKSFFDQTQLALHIKHHLNERFFKCETCKKSFNQLQDLKRHQQIHSKQPKFCCEICTKVFQREPTFQAHKMIHRGEKPYPCKFCQKSFSDAGNRIKHERIHSGEKKFRCEICAKQFLWKRTLQQHILEVHKIQGKPQSCKICGTGFKTERKLKEHVKYKHDPEYIGGSECVFCCRQFHSKHDFVGHILSHIKERPHFCKKCPADAITKSALKHHLKLHAPERERTFKCNLCPQKYFNQFNLNQHITTSHLDEKPFKCEVCYKCFKFKGSLKSHSRIHTQDKPFGCEECGKAFKSNGELRQHGVVHSNERLHTCSFCQKAFSSKIGLKTHIFAHTQEKPLKCGNCDKAFATSGELSMHRRRVHSELRPFVCKHCGKAFKFNVDLTRHKLLHVRTRALL